MNIVSLEIDYVRWHDGSRAPFYAEKAVNSFLASSIYEIGEKLVRGYSVLILGSLLCISLYTTFPCKAAPVWSDNFDDGNYDGWTVLNGTFSAGDHTLRNIGRKGGLIVHPSPVTTGTWSFDVLGVNDTDIGFMSTYPAPLSGMVCLDWGQYHSPKTEWELNLQSGGWTNLGTWTYGTITGWQHVDITRSSDGRICVYQNGTLVVDTFCTSITGSQYFWVCFSLLADFKIQNVEGAIDNIVVSNTVDIQPPSLPFYREPWFMPTVGAVVVVAIAGFFIVAYLMRRRSRT
jgi:hypothetical protein